MKSANETEHAEVTVAFASQVDHGTCGSLSQKGVIPTQLFYGNVENTLGPNASSLLTFSLGRSFT